MLLGKILVQSKNKIFSIYFKCPGNDKDGTATGRVTVTLTNEIRVETYDLYKQRMTPLVFSKKLKTRHLLV